MVCTPTDQIVPMFVCYRDNEIATNSYCEDLAWFETLATEEQEGTNVLDLYPNPAAETIRLSLNDAGAESYHILTLQGSEVLSGVLQQQNAAVNVSALPPGIYLLRIAGKNGESNVARFVKQ
jgi:hypothetical protein